LCYKAFINNLAVQKPHGTGFARRDYQGDTPESLTGEQASGRISRSGARKEAMREHMIGLIVVLFTLGQPLLGQGRLWHCGRVLVPLLGLATCVSRRRVGCRCLWAPNAEAA
jgi:hypothetical protein